VGVDRSAVDVVRRFYAAVADRDLDAAGACFTDHSVWFLPGRSPIAGVHRGWKQIRDNFLTKLGPLSGESLRVDLTEVAVGEEHVVAVQHATAEHRGKRLDVTGCQLIRVENGRIVDVRGHYSDQYAFDAFWAQ
jgi:uncharacterized protein